jgi:uncharacterized iron-regulated protein
MIGIITVSFAQDKPAYKLYNAQGKDLKYSRMLKNLEQADIIFFGELHDNPIVHWLQLELTRDLYRIKGDRLVLGAEMFESDNQLLLDEYLSGIITEEKFEDEARLWDNYKTDYKPLLKFAYESNLSFIATNVPRRYANLVYREGFGGLDSLSGEGKRLIPPLPIPYDPELPGYKSMLAMGQMGPGHAGDNLPRAQAIKDATMAHFILMHWSPGKTFLHFNGAYHSDNKEGIVWYVRKLRDDLTIMTITSVLQENTDSLEVVSVDKADFVIVVPSSMTRTY